ncbi:heavy metal translocating P-type ATPase [Gymnodinialimonas ceratoperidinii]|uniref:Cadmium-translocating P-type ATPase n=1 Tax=Gymnodinialimonas ceratoperidinii TaxID=2856823 RepID=A0A8F6YAX5_9RHOB|nr:heavy metal translocating P-type ATPase [Gymnodinialimonas ceratoperidinii]QXT40389.1 cadmium-translocating P-type ATPase [Gymnodinialimonas ceratoperidinii]
MTALADPPRASACPACDAAPLAQHMAGATAEAARLMIALPGIHCAGCISGVERALLSQPGVSDARVNLTLRRVAVEADPEVAVETLCTALERAGFEAHELDAGILAATEVDARGRALLMRLAVAVFAMMNVMLLSVAVWSGAEGVTRDMMHWISAAIAIPAVIFTGQPFYTSAWGALRAGRLNMDVPITLALALAVGTSLYETTQGGAHAYFDAAIALCTFLLAGRYLDHRTRATARSAAQELAALEVPRALRMVGQGRTESVGVADLRAGDRVRVLPGGRIPVDGVIRDGATELDRSVMTGETLPAAVALGDAVHAGEANLTGPITVEVQAAGRDTELARIGDLVAVAEAGRGNYTSLADAAAKLYAPGVHIISALAAVGWFIATADLRVALNIAAAVLIITCPCALGLAVPAVTTAASARLFRKGVLIKSGTALERLAEVDTVVFDKTGTLTDGAPEPLGLEELSAEAQSVALALAQGSAHPLAASLARGLSARAVRPAAVSDVVEHPGSGIEGRWQGQVVRLGRAGWVGAKALPTTATYLAVGENARVAIAFADTLREGAAEVVAGLHAQGKRVILLSGDMEASVRHFAARVGIAEVVAEARPEAKAEAIAGLSEGGARVLMVGDGMNDTAALTAADVSISPASALEAARAASDMVLTGQTLAPILDAMETAVAARRRIKENFTIASVYNVLAVPLAVAGLCSPLIAALAMSSSSLTVSLNALRLR